MRKTSLFIVAMALFVSLSNAQLSRYFERDMEHHVTLFGGSSIPLQQFAAKTLSKGPDAGHAIMGWTIGAQYHFLPLNGGFGPVAIVDGTLHYVNYLPDGLVGNHYTFIRTLVGARYETDLKFQNKVAFYGLAAVGMIFAKAPTVSTSESGKDADVAYCIGGGFIFDNILDVSARYSYSEVNFTGGYGELPKGNRQRLETIALSVGLIVF